MACQNKYSRFLPGKIGYIVILKGWGHFSGGKFYYGKHGPGGVLGGGKVGGGGWGGGWKLLSDSYTCVKALFIQCQNYF